MSFTPVVCYFLLLILLDVAVKSQMSSNSNSHVYIEGNSDVRYIVDSIPLSVHKEFPSNSGVKVQNGEGNTDSKTNLKFEPSLLDFKERPIGVPHHEKVTIINLNPNKTLHMSSISGNTVHFHSSFFESKIIPPLGNTSFNVVFLGREEGEIESNLFIHTSEGSFKYQVRGSSIQSPYRLRPLSGVRLPLNASFSPTIQMHNPYASPLQLVEVYSSGGEFRLELPGGELEGPRHLWEIPAFLTKPIIRVRFHARAQKNHTAYIRLKVNNSEEVLVVPLEVEVGAATGLYSPVDVIDFGIGGSRDPPTTLCLALYNSGKKLVKIQNVISTPVSKALKIEFEPVKVPPESDEPTEVAKLTFDWGVALETGHMSGRLVVKSKQGLQKLVIPYTAAVLAGGLSYDGLATRFRSDRAHLEPRPFYLENNFKLPIAITNVTLLSEAMPYFQIHKFEPHILHPGKKAQLFELVPSVPAHLTLASTLEVSTNVSTISVPLLCYDGKLIKVISPRNESELELGTVGSGTKKQIVFALVNENPVPVTVLSWETTLPATTIAIASIEHGNATTFLQRQHSHLYNSTTQTRWVRAGQYAVMRLSVRAGSLAGENHATVTVRTEYEILEFAAHMRVEHGSLQVTPDPIVFDHCFPGKLCSETLRVQSLFSVAMAVTGVGGDPRLGFSPASPPLLTPTSTSTLGTLSFDTGQLDNYLATSHNNSGSTRWQDMLELPAHCPDYDLSLLAARYDHYRNLSSRLLNLTLRLDTTEVREHMFSAVVRLGWPRLSRDLQFPLTQVGNTSRHSLVIFNPSTSQPLMLQLVPDIAYPSSTLPHTLPQGLRPEVLAGAVPGAGQFVVNCSQSDHLLRGLPLHRDTVLFLLPPSSNTTVSVDFTPTGAHKASCLLLLRNNLTVLETVQLSGTGAFAQFKFGNRKPGSSTPLLFELAEKHLKDCEREKQRKFPSPNLTVKRSFTARNTGALPISVHGFDISGLPCEGYGFRVLNCEAFSLAPNTTRKVDIAFTPDFTLARVQRTLAVWTSESTSAANYTLVATLPPFLLGPCSAVLARPAWEPLLYYCAVTFMVFLLFCVLAAAFLESDRALKCALLAMSRDNTTVQPVLDLKSIGTGVGLSSSGTVSPTLSSTDRSERSESVASSSSSPSWARVSSPSTASAHTPTIIHAHTTTQETQEPVKEKLKSEMESVASLFTSPVTKSVKRREKATVSKRLSDPSDSERRSSWASEFTKLASSPVTKSQSKSSASPAESSKPFITETKRKVSKKNINSVGRNGRETTSLPATGLCASVSEDTETSSTTTESSHDDGDKEVEVTLALRESSNGGAGSSGHKSTRTRGNKQSDTVSGTTSSVTKKTTERTTGGSASSLELEWEDDDQPLSTPTPPPAHTHTLTKKPHANRNRKSANKNGKLPEGSQGQSRSKTSSGGSKQSNTRSKDKHGLTQKRSSDKLPTLPKPTVVYEPPPPPVNLWDESRASFSDVVARSDSSKQTSLPTNTTPTPLGPIGSKKSFPSVWGGDSVCWSDSIAPPTLPPVLAPPPAHTSSFFMDTFTDTRPAPPPMVQNTSFDGGWTEPNNLLLKMLQAEEQRRMEAEEYQRRSVYPGNWSPWEPMCASEPCAVAAATTGPIQTTSANPSLWGSEVWAPPPPDTWAPPGLAPRPPPRPDPTASELDIGMDYDPFRSSMLSNIWAPHAPNSIWKPPTTGNN